MRAAARYDSQRVLIDEPLLPNPDMAQWVKEALTHYWGGPRLTESPLLKLRVVQEAMDEHNGNSANALRAILRKAIDQVKPEGERRFTGEWILYNILEMKLLEGKMVREIAMRLAMSEADLYRKQRIAIEAVAKAIMEMEVQSN
jgi:chemotaxis protein CheY-P-specific phosphatase CheC